MSFVATALSRLSSLRRHNLLRRLKERCEDASEAHGEHSAQARRAYAVLGRASCMLASMP